MSTTCPPCAWPCVHVPHRLLALGGADARDEEALGRAVRGFLR
ncbi:hypothetical protein QF037_001294 [Streptomyces canus]|nr:hypothetical protein [Streptomyces canus]MDQ0596949.1 hypothetical protein [Streptomyces canus]